MNTEEPPRIAGPRPHPAMPREKPPPDAWDTHAHIFGPSDKFSYAPGRGYTPVDAPVDRYVALLDHLGFARGVLVQGNAHGYDNRVLLDALARFPQRLRGSRLPTRVLHQEHRVNGTSWACGACAFICFQKQASPATCAASVSTCSKSSAAPCATSAGSCRFPVTGG